MSMFTINESFYFLLFYYYFNIQQFSLLSFFSMVYTAIFFFNKFVIFAAA